MTALIAHVRKNLISQPVSNPAASAELTEICE